MIGTKLASLHNTKGVECVGSKLQYHAGDQCKRWYQEYDLFIYNLVILAKLCERITMKKDRAAKDWEAFNPVLSILSYIFKAPLVPSGAPIINALLVFTQHY